METRDVDAEDRDVCDGTVLVVDDDQEEIFVLRRALAKSPVNLRLEIAQNGEDALNFLTECHAADGLDDISLILLDLNMPIMDGHAFLKTIRRDERFANLPVVVLTTSQSPAIIHQAHADGANAVVSKVDTLEDMVNIVDTIVQFWFRSAQRYYVG
ncbi:MAG: response regulator [Fimbriimonadaceae bacterium]|nr:response regulator [Alphaproteobacteria bacterium]